MNFLKLLWWTLLSFRICRLISLSNLFFLAFCKYRWVVSHILLEVSRNCTPIFYPFLSKPQFLFPWAHRFQGDITDLLAAPVISILCVYVCGIGDVTEKGLKQIALFLKLALQGKFVSGKDGFSTETGFLVKRCQI